MATKDFLTFARHIGGMDLLAAIGEAIQRSAVAWLVVFVAFIVIERVSAKERLSASRLLTSLGFWAISIPVSAIIEVLARTLWSSMGVEPVITINPTAGLTGLVALLATAVVIILYDDFLFYWFHRAQHRWFWRWHAVHHSIRSLSIVNSYHHLSESLFRSFLIILPASLFVLEVSLIVPGLAFIIWMQTGLLHSSTRLDIGRLRVFFGDNRFHRIHHSLEPRHFDRNFGALTTFWDRIFKTAYWPSADEWPDTGLEHVEEPRTVRDWLLLPISLKP